MALRGAGKWHPHAEVPLAHSRRRVCRSTWQAESWYSSGHNPETWTSCSLSLLLLPTPRLRCARMLGSVGVLRFLNVAQALLGYPTPTPSGEILQHSYTMLPSYDRQVLSSLLQPSVRLV
jgi:hypothetical protein